MARYGSFVLTVVFLLAVLSPVPATAKHLFKIASLAPEGSVWIESFKDFAAEVTEKTGGEVSFRIYPGGVMGDDRAMYRKMRVGQLHGGGFTMTGIADIVADFRVMAIPFLFRSYEEVDQVGGDLQPLFTKRFAEKGLRFVAMTEVGFIYTFSDRPRTTIDDLRQAKAWTPSNDPLSSAFLESLGISPISLSIPDVLSSLQTGLIDTAFNSLYGSIVLQWFTKAPFVTDQPYGYAYGAFIMDGKAYAPARTGTAGHHRYRRGDPFSGADQQDPAVKRGVAGGAQGAGGQFRCDLGADRGHPRRASRSDHRQTRRPGLFRGNLRGRHRLAEPAALRRHR